MKVTRTANNATFSFTGGTGGLTEEYMVEDVPVDLLNGYVGDVFELCVQNIGLSYTSPHPSIGGLYVNGITGRLMNEGTPESVSRTAARMLYEFRTPTFIPVGGVRVELGGSNAQTILNRWPNGPRKGQPILVAYNRGLLGKGGGGISKFDDQIDPASVISNTGNTRYDTVEIPIEANNAILTLTRTEFAFPAKSYAMLHHRNKKTWLGFAPETVKLRDFNAVNMVGAGTVIPSYWMCKYVFEIVDDPMYFLHVEFFRDEHTGKLIPGVDILSGSNNGYTIVDPQPGVSVDFNTLGFGNSLLV
jgi:hypothetical protein